MNLTPRQYDVVNLMACGMSNKMIARRLGIEVCSVKVHAAGAFKKLGVSSRLQAAIAYREAHGVDRR